MFEILYGTFFIRFVHFTFTKLFNEKLIKYYKYCIVTICYTGIIFINANDALNNIKKLTQTKAQRKLLSV